MTRFFTFLFIAISFGLMSQKTNQTDSKGNKQGLWVKYHEGENSKNKKFEGVFKDNVLIGVSKYYYENGERRAKIENELNGIAYTYMYHENGMIMAFGKYLNQKKDSVWTYFDEFGYLISKENFENDTLQLESVVFYPHSMMDDKGKSLKIMEHTQYKDGLKHGTWSKFYEDGAKMAVGTYKHGYKEGKFTYYRSSGAKESITHYKHAVKNGFTMSFDETGEIEKKIYFKDGKELKGEKLKVHLEKTKQEAIERAKQKKSEDSK